MRIPWKELKGAEMEALRWRRAGEIPPKITSRLRKLLNRCRKDPEAEKAICYHGSLALLHECDRDWIRATKHRKTEISLIEKVRSSMAKEPLSLRRYALQNYRAADLKERRTILRQLTQKSATEPSASPNRRPVRSRRVRTSGRGGGR
jgi:hypothetical protein